VRGIAARVGVSPNVVCTYFPDKAAVIKALVERLLREVDHDVLADRGASAWWRSPSICARTSRLTRAR
jgi:AcrR family transcriptional regulator